MNSVKELLRDMIDLMSDEEARRMLDFARHLRQEHDISLTLKRLATDPAFKVPAEGIGIFRAIEPIQGKGIAASKLVVDDRR